MPFKTTCKPLVCSEIGASVESQSLFLSVRKSYEKKPAKLRYTPNDVVSLDSGTGSLFLLGLVKNMSESTDHILRSIGVGRKKFIFCRVKVPWSEGFDDLV